MLQLSLRQKLALVSLLILLIPWVGIHYIQAIEDYLQTSLLDNLSHYTRSVAAGLAQQPELIPDYPSGKAVYALPLQKEVFLDGYNYDWVDYLAYAQQLELNDYVSAEQSRPKLLTGLYEGSLYLHLTIPDQNISYVEQQLPKLTENNLASLSVDAVLITLRSYTEQLKLVINTEAPGSIKAINLANGQWESLITGKWLESDDGLGYQLELKIPFQYAEQGINVTVFNNSVDEHLAFKLSTKAVLPLLISPKALNKKVSEFGKMPGRRIWLLDNDGRVLVKSGSLELETPLTAINPLFAWLLTPQIIADPWHGKMRFERDDIQQALQGKNDSRRLAGTEGESIILSSAWPIKVEQQTIAVLFIEESTAAIQIMQRSALSELLNLSLFVFLIISFSLIGFAGHLTTRIRRLRDITDQSIDDHGRVQGEIPSTQKGDELDDLSSHVSGMLTRLRQYHEYLEMLASRLSHELRTPVAVVRSSLENIHLNDPSVNNEELLERADQGIVRLQKILNRMGEASRLEQSINDSQMENFIFAEFLSDLNQAYQSVYPLNRFKLLIDPEIERITVSASKDLLAQCLDKLINNAISYAAEDTAIEISLSKNNHSWQLSVTNYGSNLPFEMEQQLFQSMVSVRDTNNQDEEPHLGLGLHIVRLIAEFHQGSAGAKNIERGVCFTINLPLDNGV